MIPADSLCNPKERPTRWPVKNNFKVTEKRYSLGYTVFHFLAATIFGVSKVNKQKIVQKYKNTHIPFEGDISKLD